MGEFRVVDLFSQFDEVTRHVEGWPAAKVLEWLGQYGEVEWVYPDLDIPWYTFHSPTGLDHSFGFDSAGRLADPEFVGVVDMDGAMKNGILLGDTVWMIP